MSQGLNLLWFIHFIGFKWANNYLTMIAQSFTDSTLKDRGTIPINDIVSFLHNHLHESPSQPPNQEAAGNVSLGIKTAEAKS
jgi:hypothetical protein